MSGGNEASWGKHGYCEVCGSGDGAVDAARGGAVLVASIAMRSNRDRLAISAGRDLAM